MECFNVFKRLIHVFSDISNKSDKQTCWVLTWHAMSWVVKSHVLSCVFIIHVLSWLISQNKMQSSNPMIEYNLKALHLCTFSGSSNWGSLISILAVSSFNMFQLLSLSTLLILDSKVIKFVCLRWYFSEVHVHVRLSSTFSTCRALFMLWDYRSSRCSL